VDEVGRFPQNLSAKPTKYFANVISRALRDLGERAARAAILTLPNAVANWLHSVNQPLRFFARHVTGAAGANHSVFCMPEPFHYSHAKKSPFDANILPHMLKSFNPLRAK